MRGWMMAAALLIAGCTPVELRSPTQARPAPAAASGEAITLATGPCFGTCPVYRVTIRPDGTGTFEGHRFTAVTGTRAFRATPDAYRRFAAMLAPYRPASGTLDYERDRALCGDEIATDMPSADVIWHGDAERRLHFYYGCGMERNRTLRETLAAAPRTLPIAGFIGAK